MIGRVILKSRPNEARPLASPQAPLFVFPPLLGRQPGDLLKNFRRGRLLGRKRQLQVADNPVHDRIDKNFLIAIRLGSRSPGAEATPLIPK